MGEGDEGGREVLPGAEAAGDVFWWTCSLVRQAMKVARFHKTAPTGAATATATRGRKAPVAIEAAMELAVS
jgi:hypothetical protein